MKFDEKKWRTLAANKPDELHSYIPQSSINELFDEIERLEKENFKLKEANEDVQSRLDDYRQDYAKVANDLKRKFIHCDIGINSIQTVRDRLVEAKANFQILEIKDGVSLFRNPQQTMDKLATLIPGLQKGIKGISSFWFGAISKTKGRSISA